MLGVSNLYVPTLLHDPAYSTTACSVASSAPAAAAPPPVRQPWRSSGSRRRGVTRHLLVLPRCAGVCVGALVHWILDCGGASRWQNTALGRSHLARAQPESPMPVNPNAGGSPDSAAAVQVNLCHTLSVRRWSGASPQRGGRLVARSAVAAWRNHHVANGGSCTAREQRWNGLITPSRPCR